MWERRLPDFKLQWRPLQGGLCCNEEFEKAVAEIQHDTYHNGAGSLLIEMLVQGEVGPHNGPPRCQGVFLVVLVLTRGRVPPGSRSG